MDALSLFGLFAVTLMLVCYALEPRGPRFVLGFAAACALGSAYGFLLGAWPFGLVEAIRSAVALPPLARPAMTGPRFPRASGRRQPRGDGRHSTISTASPGKIVTCGWRSNICAAASAEAASTMA